MGGVFSIQILANKALDKLKAEGSFPPDPSVVQRHGPYVSGALLGICALLHIWGMVSYWGIDEHWSIDAYWAIVVYWSIVVFWGIIKDCGIVEYQAR